MPDNTDKKPTTNCLRNKSKREIKIPTLFQLIVECCNENRQRELYEQLTSAGYVCKVMTL